MAGAGARGRRAGGDRSIRSLYLPPGSLHASCPVGTGLGVGKRMGEWEWACVWKFGARMVGKPFWWALLTRSGYREDCVCVCARDQGTLKTVCVSQRDEEGERSKETSSLVPLADGRERDF